MTTKSILTITAVLMLFVVVLLSVATFSMDLYNVTMASNTLQVNTTMSMSEVDDEERTIFNDNTIVTNYVIPFHDKNISCISLSPPASPLSLIFTQGATGRITSPSVVNFAAGFSTLKNITCFQGRSNLGVRIDMFEHVMKYQPCNVIGGRSMGSRAAIYTAKEFQNVEALILVSFPLLSAKGERREHLLFDIDPTIDVLFVIGDRDSMCDLDQLRALVKRMKPKSWILVVKNADHMMNMNPFKATKRVGEIVGKVVARWIEDRNDSLTDCEIHWDEDKSEVIASSWKQKSTTSPIKDLS